MPKRQNIVTTIREMFEVEDAVAGNGLPLFGRFMNEAELKSIRSLIAYVAFEKNIDQGVVQQLVQKRFGVAGIEKFRSGDYNEIVYYFVELIFDEIDGMVGSAPVNMRLN